MRLYFQPMSNLRSIAHWPRIRSPIISSHFIAMLASSLKSLRRDQYEAILSSAFNPNDTATPNTRNSSMSESVNIRKRYYLDESTREGQFFPLDKLVRRLEILKNFILLDEIRVVSLEEPSKAKLMHWLSSIFRHSSPSTSNCRFGRTQKLQPCPASGRN